MIKSKVTRVSTFPFSLVCWVARLVQRSVIWLQSDYIIVTMTSPRTRTRKLTKSRAQGPEYPSHHADPQGTSFLNPWSKEKESSFFDTYNNWTLPQFLTQGWAKFPLEWAKEHTGHPHKPVEVIDPDFGNRKFRENRHKLLATWLGHAVSHWLFGFLPLILAHAACTYLVIPGVPPRGRRKLWAYTNNIWSNFLWKSWPIPMDWATASASSSMSGWWSSGISFRCYQSQSVSEIVSNRVKK
jgi:hypothetical protein